ncbi:hypothetical protein HU200_053931 [Digitaria exilis]|uniref:Uncharacterized protein n=1 Tax=Digitaria exilis TaxID=1010633 RepID=A0A835AIB8_9POAL|nr:hypothetical protein HU200_053931 [Digitaria exilis]
MARDNRRYNWEAEMGGGEKRRFEDERDGNRSYQDQNSGGWREEERRRELQLRERMQRDRDGYQPGGSRQFREEEDAGKRRAMDGRRSDFDSGERNFNFNQGNQIPQVRDRLGGVRNQGGHGEEGFTMALYNTWATVTPSSRDPAASSTLQTGWIRLSNVPDRGRSVEVVTLIGELAGNVIVVDELSLIKEDIIELRFRPEILTK